MNLSLDQIERIRELASLLTPISDIAVLIDVDEDLLRIELSNKNSLARKAYAYSKAKTSLQLRKQEIELANVGSPLAVQLTSSYLLNMTSEEDF